MTRNPQTSPRIRRHVAKPTLPRRWAMVLALLLFALLPAARAHASRGAPSQVLRAVQSAGKSIVRAIEEEAPRVGIVAAREVARESGSQKQEGSTQVGRVAPASTGPMDATPCWIVLVVVAVAIPTGIAWAVRGNKRSQPLLDEDVAPPSTATSSVLPPRRVTMAPEPGRAPPTQPLRCIPILLNDTYGGSASSGDQSRSLSSCSQCCLVICWHTSFWEWHSSASCS